MVKIYLNNKNGRCPKCKKTAFKELCDFFRMEKSIRIGYYRIFIFEGEKSSSYSCTKRKFTNKTMIQTVVTVRNFSIVFRIIVMAFFFNKCFFQVMNRVHRL